MQSKHMILIVVCTQLLLSVALGSCANQSKQINAVGQYAEFGLEDQVQHNLVGFISTAIFSANINFISLLASLLYFLLFPEKQA
jgi:hypothetical protein